MGDVGQERKEEVDFQPAASPGGENYGWRKMEGSLCYNPATGCNDGTLKLPILEYDHSLGCSITGGYRYRGSQYPALAGIYIYGDFCSGRIWGATRGASSWTAAQLLDTALNISAFGEDQAGELYLAHRNGVSGAVYKVISSTSGEIIIDNAPAGVQDAAGGRTFTGTWCVTGASGKYGSDSLYSCGSAGDTYRWTPNIPAAGAFDVYVRWTSATSRATAVPFRIVHSGGTTTKSFNQQTGGGAWVLHGRYSFSAGKLGYAETNDLGGQASADALRFVPAATPTGAVLTVSKSGSGTGRVTTVPAGIDCGATCSASFALGVTLTVTANPDAGSVFTGWGGPCAGTAPCTLTMNDSKFLAANFRGPDIVLDNAARGVQDSAGGRTFTGTWCLSHAKQPFQTDSLDSCGKGLDTYRWTPNIKATGSYDVYVWWTSHPNRSTNVPINVVHNSGAVSKSFNQRTGGGQWVLHGRYAFNVGKSGYVEVTDSNGQAAADAVRLVPAF